jgi:hypothetical protein
LFSIDEKGIKKIALVNGISEALRPGWRLFGGV